MIQIVLYVLASLGCLFIAITAVKVIIWCFLQKLCCKNLIKNYRLASSSKESTMSMPSAANSPMTNQELRGCRIDLGVQTVNALESLIFQLSQPRTVAENVVRNGCVCPLCANQHLPKTPLVSSDHYRLNNNYKDNLSIGKNSEQGSVSSQDITNHHSPASNSLGLITARPDSSGSNAPNDVIRIQRIVMPIVSHRQASGVCISKDPIQELKRYSSYGDVVMELKSKFASNSALNSII